LQCKIAPLNALENIPVCKVLYARIKKKTEMLKHDFLGSSTMKICDGADNLSRKIVAEGGGR